MHRLSVRLRWRLGVGSLVVGSGCVVFAPVAFVNSERRAGFLLLLVGALLAFLGWIELPPHGPVRVNWRQTDFWGITLREDLVVYGLQTVAFVVVGFVLGWYWSAMISLAAYIGWFMLRMRERR